MLEKKGVNGQDFGCVVHLDTKAVTEQGEFEGYASTFGNEDQGGDIVVKGAFAKSIARGIGRVKMFRDHDRTKIIGGWTEIVENEKGLMVRGQLDLEIQHARETHVLLKKERLDGLSIGFRTIKHRFDQAKPMVRYLEEVDLKEISIVPFGMNKRAVITGVKGNLPTEREFEQWLMRDAGFTAQQAKAIIADGFKALKGMRDAAGSEAEVFDLLNRAALALR
jgi:HK97 family phage prohead protease